MYVPKVNTYNFNNALQEIVNIVNQLVDSNNSYDSRLHDLEHKMREYVNSAEMQKEKKELIEERRKLKVVLDKLPALIKKAVEEDNTDALRKWIDENR